MLDAIKEGVSKFRNIRGPIRILTHHDTGGITSGAIIAKAMQREDKIFKISVLKQLEKDVLSQLNLEKDEIVFFLDFGSSMIEEIKQLNTNSFILDNHEFPEGDLGLPENVVFINPHLFGNEEINSAAMAYFFAKELNAINSDMAPLAVLGMVGDYGDLSNIGSLAKSILKNSSDISVKESLLLFPATRPIHKALEFSSKIYIPGVTGSTSGVLNLLREAKIEVRDGKDYRTLLDLDKDETSRLMETISKKTADANSIKDAFGEIYLIKFLSHLEDARELSMQLNACGKMGHGDLAILCCMGSRKAKFFAENIYITYRHLLLSALKWISVNEKIEGSNYIIVNAGSEIKDTILGTTLSILAASYTYPAGTMLIGMSETEDGKIKVSARVSGRQKGANLQKLIEPLARAVGGEGGGHDIAAGGIIPIEKGEEFLTLLQKGLEMRNMEIKIN